MLSSIVRAAVSVLVAALTGFGAPEGGGIPRDVQTICYWFVSCFLCSVAAVHMCLAAALVLLAAIAVTHFPYRHESHLLDEVCKGTSNAVLMLRHL